MNDILSIRRWLPGAFLICTVILIGLYWVGLAASHEMDYRTVGFRLADAIQKTAGISPSDLLHDNYTASQIWFAPFGLSIGILYWAFRKRRLRIVFAIIGVLVQYVVMTPSVLFLVFALPSFVFGAPDGESWGEAWLALTAAGSWMLLAIGIALHDTFTLVGDRCKHSGHAQRPIATESVG